MKKFAAFAATLMLVGGIAAAPVVEAKPRLTGEQQLAKMLEGRVAGKPVRCITLGMASSTTVIDKTAIVYQLGRTYYVNRPTNASTLDSDDILVTKTSLPQLCNLDTVQLHDRSSPRMWNGFVGLRDFVPYTKVNAAPSH